MAKTIKKKDINLISAMYRSNKPASKSKGKGLLIFCIILFVVIVAAATALLMAEEGRLKEQKAELQYYLENPDNIAKYNEAIAAQQQALLMSQDAANLETILLNISSTPALSSSDIRKIFGYAENRVEIEGITFSRETGILSFTASGDTPTVIPIFVAQLRMSDLFEDVQYQGYAGGDVESGYFNTDPLTGEQVSETITTQTFGFTVTCLLISPTPALPTEPANQPVTD